MKAGSGRMPGDDRKEVPDWTVWLRSRLEKLSTSEGEAAEVDEPSPVAAPAPEDDQAGARAAPEPAGAVEPDEPPVVEEAAPPAAPASSEPQPLVATSPHEEAAPPAAPASSEPQPLAATAPEAAPPAAPVSPPRTLPVALDPTPPVAQTDPALVAVVESLRTATIALSTRVDALADATSSFRSVINERLDSYAETVLRLSKGANVDIEEYRRMHMASITELRRTGADTAASLVRLAAQMDELVTIQADDERWAKVMGELCDEVRAERSRNDEAMTVLARVVPGDDRRVATEETLQDLIAELGEPMPGDDRLVVIDEALHRLSTEIAGQATGDDRLVAIEETLQRVSLQLAGLAERAAVPAPPPPLLDEAGVQALAEAVAEAVAARLPPPPRLRTRDPAPPRPRRATPIRARGPVDPGA